MEYRYVWRCCMDLDPGVEIAKNGLGMVGCLPGFELCSYSRLGRLNACSSRRIKFALQGPHADVEVEAASVFSLIFLSSLSCCLKNPSTLIPERHLSPSYASCMKAWPFETFPSCVHSRYRTIRSVMLRYIRPIQERGPLISLTMPTSAQYLRPPFLILAADRLLPPARPIFHLISSCLISSYLLLSGCLPVGLSLSIYRTPAPIRPTSLAWYSIA